MTGNSRFFFACLITALVLLIAPALLAASRAPTAIDGQDSAQLQAGATLWHSYDCQGCHTLYGRGGDYAADLTHSYAERGEDALRAFLLQPGPSSAAGSNAPGAHMRQMPRLGLTRGEADSLIAFLSDISQSPLAASWPPPPLAGGVVVMLPTATALEPMPDPSALGDPAVDQQPAADPATAGRALFSRAPANCASCHSLEPGIVVVGPSLAGIAAQAGERVAGMSAAEYLRSSILHPNAYIVPGFSNVMAQNLGQVLSGEEVDALVAFLLRLHEAETP